MWLENNKVPIYKQIINYLENLILEKKIISQEAIPSVRIISVEFKINPQTILKAFNELLSKGIIYKKRGMGMFVSKDARDNLIAEQKKIYISSELPRLIKKGISMDINKNDLKKIINEILKEI